MGRLAQDTTVSRDFYDKEYFTTGIKSAYKPYGPGEWAGWLTEMVIENLHPLSVLDVGCAMGYVVKLFGDHGIPAYGFDISDYAMGRKVTSRVWHGSADDPMAWRTMDVDLVLATELVEHLTMAQARAFLKLAAEHGKRLLILGVYGEDYSPGDDADWSHVGIRPMRWWLDEAAIVGWYPKSAEAFNADKRSENMQWAGRFLLFDQVSDGDYPVKKAKTATGGVEADA